MSAGRGSCNRDGCGGKEFVEAGRWEWWVLLCGRRGSRGGDARDLEAGALCSSCEKRVE